MINRLITILKDFFRSIICIDSVFNFGILNTFFCTMDVVNLASMSELPLSVRENALRVSIFPADQRIAIVDVEPVGGRILSERPFKLRVQFAFSSLNPPR